MTILALEFSSGQRSVAVGRKASILAEAVESEGRRMAAFAMIEKILAQAKIEREEVETIAVGLGPGSYTGIRTAIALAEGWKLARAINMTGVSSVAATAARAHTEKIFGRVIVVVDAQRDEFYCAQYAVADTGWTEILPLKILRRGEVESMGRGGIIVGPEAPKFFPGGRAVFPHAAAVARLAASQYNLQTSQKLEPIYLRETNFTKARPALAQSAEG